MASVVDTHVSRVAENLTSIGEALNLSFVRPLAQLRSLCLHGNAISDMVGVDALVHLVELNLSSNYITRIKGLDGLQQLRNLNLASNRLESLDGLNPLVSLERFTCAHNHITSLQGLTTLHGANALTSLDIRNNCIQDLKELSVIAPLHKLTSLQVSGGTHPNAISLMSTFRAAVTATFPQVSLVCVTLLLDHPMQSLNIHKYHRVLTVDRLVVFSVTTTQTGDEQLSNFDRTQGTTPDLDPSGRFFSPEIVILFLKSVHKLEVAI